VSLTEDISPPPHRASEFFNEPRASVVQKEYLAAPRRASECFPDADVVVQKSARRSASSERVSFTARSVVVQKSTSPLRIEASEFSRTRSRRGTKDVLAAPHRGERGSSTTRKRPWYKRSCPRRSANRSERFLPRRRASWYRKSISPLRIERARFFTTRSVVVQKSISPAPRTRRAEFFRDAERRGSKRVHRRSRVERASASRRGASVGKTEELISPAPRRGERVFHERRSVVVQKVSRRSASSERVFSRRGASWYKECLAAPHRASEFFTTRKRRGTKEYLAAPHERASSFTTRKRRGNKITRSPPAVPVRNENRFNSHVALARRNRP